MIIGRVGGIASSIGLVLLAGCAVSTQAGDETVGEVASAVDAYSKGADVSEAYYAQSKGVSFKDTNGQAQDPMQILQNHGFGWARCRLMMDVNTSSPQYALFQDVNYVINNCARPIKSHGMKFLLDLHVSNWWADPGHQQTPTEWSGHDINTLYTDVYSYTKSVMSQLVANGVAPDMVQIGNENNYGMLWSVGNQSNYASLQKSGANGIKDGRGSAPMPRIMVHIAYNNWSTSQIVSWYQTFVNNGGWIDVIGLSYYPMWDPSLGSLSSTISQLRSNFSWASVYVVETASFYSPTGTGEPYPETPAGQAQFLHDLKNTVTAAGGSGIFYWGTFWSQTNMWLNAPGWNNDTAMRALFDNNAQALSGIDAF